MFVVDLSWRIRSLNRFFRLAPRLVGETVACFVSRGREPPFLLYNEGFGLLFKVFLPYLGQQLGTVDQRVADHLLSLRIAVGQHLLLIRQYARSEKRVAFPPSTMQVINAKYCLSE